MAIFPQVSGITSMLQTLVCRVLALMVLAAALLGFAIILEASDSVTVNNGANQNITAHSVCKKVTNNSSTGLSVYVPTVTAAEWSSFYTNPPSGISLDECSTPRTVVFLTSGTTWIVPADWDNAHNMIEVIGGGGGGGGGNAARGYIHTGGGAGGGYSAVTNLSLTPGASVSYVVGAGGNGGVSSGNGGMGGDTYFCNSISNCTSITDSSVVVGAKGGGGGRYNSSATALGGQASNGLGSIKYSGGNGQGASGSYSGGGGGAAGPNGNGVSAVSAAGGAGDAGFGGAGGAANSPGNNGSEWDATHGSGGGAGGRTSAGPGQNAGLYGAGGGGGAGQNGGNGTQGIIVITYGQ